jgi:hypothetical protein
LLDPNDFSIRVQSNDYVLQDPCGSDRNRSLQTFLESRIPAAEILRLRKGVQRAAQVYAYYERDETLPDNPLQNDVLPNGGAAHALVQALGERASGRLWAACKQELQGLDPNLDLVDQFKC